MDDWHAPIRLIHIWAVTLSGSLFALRGLMMIAQSPLSNHGLLRKLSWTIDTILLIAAISLTMIVHQYPLLNAWLSAKVLLLLVYIGLGTMALRRGRTRRIRIISYLAALAVFLYIVSIALTRDPRGGFGVWFMTLTG